MIESILKQLIKLGAWASATVIKLRARRIKQKYLNGEYDEITDTGHGPRADQHHRD